MEDEEIVQLLEARSEMAIATLEEKYGRTCFSIAQNILTSKEDSEECVNDCYFGVWNQIPPTKPISLKAYVYRLTRNTALKKYHKNTAKKRNSTYDISLEELKEAIGTNHSPEQQLFVKELTQYLNQFLHSLLEENQNIFVLRYWFGETVEAIAGKVGMKPNTVTVRLKRLREKLQKFLQEKGYFYDG